jgi:imidazole glycerol-phosphate synthase subunit HisF
LFNKEEPSQAPRNLYSFNVTNGNRESGFSVPNVGRLDFEVASSYPNNLTKRIIPCLDIKNGRVVKGTNFKNLKDSGDPVELANYYYKQGADELVFLDITASNEQRKIVIDLAKKVAKKIFIPFTIGGGIKSIEDIRDIIQNGADKISLNSAAVKRPKLISEASKMFGSQCIVVAIDVKKIGLKYKVFIKSGSEETEWEAFNWAKNVEQLGAGEILLTSMDGDGTQKGYDLEITKLISDSVNIPVIASGGAGSLEDLFKAVTKGKADAVLLASLLHEKKLTIKEIKNYLINKNIPIRI